MAEFLSKQEIDKLLNIASEIDSDVETLSEAEVEVLNKLANNDIGVSYISRLDDYLELNMILSNHIFHIFDEITQFNLRSVYDDMECTHLEPNQYLKVVSKFEFAKNKGNIIFYFPLKFTQIIEHFINKQNNTDFEQYFKINLKKFKLIIADFVNDDKYVTPCKNIPKLNLEPIQTVDIKKYLRYTNLEKYSFKISDIETHFYVEFKNDIRTKLNYFWYRKKFDDPFMEMRELINWRVDFDITSSIKELNDINQQDKHGYTLLMLAAKKSNKKCVVELIKHGADTEITNKHGSTALESVVGNSIWGKRQPEIIEALVKMGANIDPNILWNLVVNSEFGDFKQLVELGANINHTNKEGISLYEFAQQCDKEYEQEGRFINYLESKGIKQTTSEEIPSNSFAKFFEGIFSKHK
jgi:ankyrin repeat protein